jgi:tetrahydromethanopterin S-methyltransferase subunit G
LELRVETEATKVNYLERDIGEIKTRLGSIDGKLETIQKEQAAFFGAKK